jgi:MFS family permease
VSPAGAPSAVEGAHRRPPGIPSGFPGWWVVGGCFFVLVTSAGLGFYGLAVYLAAFSREQGWPLASISLATTVYFLVSGFFALVVARLMGRVDVRWVVSGGGVLSAASLVLLGRVEEQWQLFPVYAVFAIGFSASGLVPISTVVTTWFHARRSVALAVASTGLSVGGIVVTPIAKWLIDEFGMRTASPWLGAWFLVGVVPVTLWLLLPDPAKFGWMPDGERISASGGPVRAFGTAFVDAVRSRFFVAVTASYVCLMAAQVGGMQQLVRLVEERADRNAATLATTVLAATSVIARLIGGKIAGNVDLQRLTLLFAGLQAVAMLALAFAPSTFTLFVSIVLLGATVGNILMLQPLLLVERFGVLDYPRIFGRSQFVATFGIAGGPFLLGWLHDVAGGYRVSYLVAAGLSVLGVVFMSTAGPARSPD